MNLETQIITILFVFSFSLVYSLIFNLFYKYLFYQNKYFLLFYNCSFMLIMYFLFIICLTIINNGIIHIYMLFIFIIGFWFGNKIFRKYRGKL